MFSFILQRLMTGFVTLFGVAVIVFMLMRVIPGDAAVMLTGAGAGVVSEARARAGPPQSGSRSALAGPVRRLGGQCRRARPRHFAADRQSGDPGHRPPLSVHPADRRDGDVDRRSSSAFRPACCRRAMRGPGLTGCCRRVSIGRPGRAIVLGRAAADSGTGLAFPLERAAVLGAVLGQPAAKASRNCSGRRWLSACASLR